MGPWSPPCYLQCGRTQQYDRSHAYFALPHLVLHRADVQRQRQVVHVELLLWGRHHNRRSLGVPAYKQEKAGDGQRDLQANPLATAGFPLVASLHHRANEPLPQSLQRGKERLLQSRFKRRNCLATKGKGLWLRGPNSNQLPVHRSSRCAGAGKFTRQATSAPAGLQAARQSRNANL